MKRPQQSEQLHQQVDDEPAVVPLSHAVLDPGAVVVEATNAVFTRLTVLRSHWLLLEKKGKERERGAISTGNKFNHSPE